MMPEILIGAKSGTDPRQIEKRIEIQLRLAEELSHAFVNFRYIEIQPPGNLNRGFDSLEIQAIEKARSLGFSLGFELPHIWGGLDVDPCIDGSLEDILHLTRIANDLGVDYLFTNPGDLYGSVFDHVRWTRNREIHEDMNLAMSEIHPCSGLENTNPLRHLSDGTVQGFFGMFPEDLAFFEFVVLDIAHAQFVVNNVESAEYLDNIRLLMDIHKRQSLSLNDFSDLLGEKIQVVHVANSKGKGLLEKEGLKIRDGDADCSAFLSNVLRTRQSPLRLVSEPSPIPYGMDYVELADLMYEEEKVIFDICTFACDNR